MKKIFLAFSILLSFSFSWAQERSSNPGTDPIEPMAQDGGGTNAIGVKGVCANCAKNTYNGGLFKNTNPGAAASQTDPANPAPVREGTR